jgi:hypothetical protein
LAAPSPADRRPRLALVAVVLTAFVLLAGLSQLVTSPRSLADEVRYVIAAGSLAEGSGLELRGEEYGFGPVYPTILAAILAVAPDRETAYPFLKVANALLFALAAVPLYLVARRLLPTRWSLGVAALSLAIPTSVSVSLVMTESAAYPAASLAILAIVLALERPSVGRQLAVLGAVALAFLTRAQFVVLFPAYLAALALLWAVVPAYRPRDRQAARMYWPTLAVVAIGIVLVVAIPLVSGRAPVGLPSAYGELWDDYDLLEVGKLVVYHLAGLEIYLAVIPLAVSPIVLWRLLRAARAGSVEAGAFASAFLAVNICFVLVAAAFASTTAGFGHLHDRYLFYVVPLWLVVLAVWLHDGLPRPIVATALGAALALALPALATFELIGGEEGQEAGAAVTYLWSAINAYAFETFPDEISGRRILALFVVVLVAATLFAPRRLRLALGASVAAVLVVATAVAWRDSARTAEDFEAVLPDRRTWVDEAVGTGATVTSLYVSAECDRAPWTANGLLLTEFFNRAVRSTAHVDERDPSLLPSTDVRVSADGAIVEEAGRPLEADAVLAAAGVELAGRRLATGTTLPLVLWQIDGPVRLARARSTSELHRSVCAVD